VIQSQSEIESLTAEVQTDTTREDTRSSLRAALSGYVAPEKDIPISNEETKDTLAIVLESSDGVAEVAEIEPSTTLVCTDTVAPVVTVDTWGLVNTTLAEGARVIASLELDETGVPKHRLQIPMTPSVAPSPQCLEPDGMVGIALDGRVIKTNTPFSTNTEGIAGYALDGFGIFNMYENGNVVASADLDQCHGHTHTIVWNGELMLLYHYHLTEDSPYTLGCFKGVPISV
jgi:hypothetical protein